MRGAEDGVSSPTLASLSMARGLAAVPRGGAVDDGEERIRIRAAAVMGATVKL